MSDETPNPETTPEAPAAEAPPQTVPYERFAQKVAEIKALESKLAEASQLSDVAKNWEDRFKSLSAEHQSEKSQWSQTTALLKAGINDEDISELARWRFSKSESEDFSEWLESEAPNDPVLKVHLSQPTAPTDAPPTPKPPTAQPSPNAGARTAPPPRGEFSPEAVQNMSIEDLKRKYSKIAGAWGYTPRNFK